MKTILYFAAGLFIVLCTPIVLFRNIGIILRAVFQHRDQTWAFGETDVFFRGWYEKIARDFRTYGRFGYAWDDGVGLPLGPRFYNNLITYWLYDRLGAARYAAVGWIIAAATAGFIVSSGTFSAISSGFLIALAVYWLLVSPTLTAVFTHLSKPEVFWWWLAGLGFWFAFEAQIAIAAVIWSILAMVNVPVAIMSGLVMGAPTVVLALVGGVSPLGLIWLLPGIGKIGFRVFEAHRSGYLNMIKEEQTGLWTRGIRLGGDELLFLFSSIALLTVGVATLPDRTAVVATSLFAMGFQALYYFNFRKVYINDNQSYAMLYFWASLTIGSVMNNVIALLVPVAVTLPAVVGFTLKGNYLARIIKTKTFSYELTKGVALSALKAIWRFPDVVFIARPSYAETEFFTTLSKLPQWSRIAFESAGRMRESPVTRRLHAVLTEPLLQRRVAAVNDMYASFTPEFRTKYQKLFNFSAYGKKTTAAIEALERLWVGYIVTTSKRSRDNLIENGFSLLVEIDVQKDVFLRMAASHAPAGRVPTVCLLKAPYTVPSILPCIHKGRVTGLAVNLDGNCFGPEIPYAMFPGLKLESTDLVLDRERTNIGYFVLIKPNRQTTESPVRLSFG